MNKLIDGFLLILPVLHGQLFFLFGWDVHFLYTVFFLLFNCVYRYRLSMPDLFPFWLERSLSSVILEKFFFLFFTPSAAFTTTIEWTVRWGKFLTFVFGWSFQFVSDPGVVYFNSTTIIDLVNVRKRRIFYTSWQNKRKRHVCPMGTLLFFFGWYVHFVRWSWCNVFTVSIACRSAQYYW